MMETVNQTSLHSQQLLEPLTALLSSYVIVPFLVVLVAFLSWRPGTKKPPRLRETIPFVSNAYQYMTDMSGFLQRAKKAFETSDIVQLRLGPKTAYLVTGSEIVPAMFRSSRGIRNEVFMELAMDKMWCTTKSELAMFHNDRSGRGNVPELGADDMPVNKRHWYLNHRLYDDFLTHKHYAKLLAAKYFETFSQRLDAYPIGEWTTFRLMDMLKKDMGESAVLALFGEKILEMNPGFIDLYWALDERLLEIALGLPQFLNPEPFRLQQQFFKMTRKYFESAWENYDWSKPGAEEAHWDPHFGARVSRELAKWLKPNFCIETIAGFYTAFLTGQNSNTLPTATWAIMELAKDPDLFNAVRQEVLTAYMTDPDTGARSIDSQKLVNLPLLQSVYTEVMRLHISVNIMREVTEPITLGGYNLKKGALMLAPSQVAHYDHQSWDADNHPATEFWAARHVKYVETVDEAANKVREPKFALAGRHSSFFPFGGGVSICPGRNFAKQEIMMTLGILIAKFDIEFIEWTNLDGSKSNRPAKNDDKYNGAAAMPPDRDMKVRWKRLW